MSNVGRPTKYTPELQAKADWYVDNYTHNDDVIPSVEGLAELLEITCKTIYEWQKQENKAEFSNTLDRIKQKQKKVLLNSGLKGEFNSNICKLALGNHGMSEKQIREHDVTDGVKELLKAISNQDDGLPDDFTG